MMPMPRCLGHVERVAERRPLQQPALSIPIGTTTGGLPIGMQIVGPRHSDDLVLAVGRFAEQVLA
jgi:Asp-tRNA(Asn)/Glu-tRNA(Gln) amidotransferase A subunit family amidase